MTAIAPRNVLATFSAAAQTPIASSSQNVRAFDGLTIRRPEHCTDDYAAAAQLYRECLDRVFSDGEIHFHLVVAPTLAERALVIADVSDEMAEELCLIVGDEVLALDCVVVLGAGAVEMRDDEAAMTALVTENVAEYVTVNFSCADRGMGWVGNGINKAALTSMMIAAEPELTETGSAACQLDRVRDEAVDELAVRYGGCRTSLRQENGSAIDAIHRVVESARETYGGFLALPARKVDLVEGCRRILAEVIGDMDRRPIGVI